MVEKQTEQEVEAVGINEKSSSFGSWISTMNT
jgi:hypothetical protein